MKFLFSISVLIFLPACSADKTALENIEADVNTDVDADGFHVGEDCDDTNETINPAATEMCDGVDNNCDGVVDENVTIVIYEDSDGDGYGNAASQIDACEVLPGYASNGTDCNDEESKAFPGNLEVCDGVDNDCNGATDDEDLNLDLNSAFIYYIDLDGDGYGNSETGLLRCSEEEGHVLNGEDCDDENASIHPQADEVCDTIDNDCDDLIDLDDDSMDPGSSSVYYLDADGDGYGDDSQPLDACIPPEGYVMLSGDCDDTNSSVSPVADEICDEIDNDCNDLIDANDPNVTAYGTGVSQTCAAETCKVIMDDGYSSGDGYYWIDPASSGAFEVYCDMSTDGGGWSIMVQNLNFPTTNIYDEYDYADFCDSYGMIYAGREIENSASWLAQKRMLWNTNHNLRQNGWPNGWIVSYEMGGSLAMPMFRTTAGLQSIFDGTLVSLPPNIVGDRCDPGGGEYLCGYWYDAGWSDSDLSVYPDPEDWASAYNHEETYISCMFR